MFVWVYFPRRGTPVRQLHSVGFIDIVLSHENVILTFSRDLRLNSKDKEQFRRKEHCYKLPAMLLKSGVDGNILPAIEKAVSHEFAQDS